MSSKKKKFDPNSILRDEMKYSLMCKSKKSYDSEYQAKYSADEFARIRGGKTRVYLCPYCHKWHITKT